ncbi:3-methyl-2-oxobutanoate dehydrogenase subunit VorB [Paludicola sp. MB14-C6]|uniref:3-methyl-2-oxobutanoate dehydrogenase subunit VorB n=1 Tax=Paludihabitans sp. MB14-C6 TaxID=3070656 RepID=UPI0027DAEE43|nr:3-methyl-2-oxobutanoate dehydrogenase subunit VorB [Paludicola sp. MB14-C6]WMJ22781.1 3-methyl-2-oxobutanoate dehydrogenase subunit VorB [Paludicola sp. MB14-C6]
MGQKYLMKGNEAIAEAAIRNGCMHFFGYPITPQTEVSAYMSKVMPKIGGTFLQAESEIAAINMVLGAASCGIRAMTSSSSPGISLKSEGISYIAGSDIPCVILNVMRGGPGLGGIQPSQADYWQATKALGHGDFQLIAFAPATVQEIVDLMGTAFDLSDKYRVPALILADGMLGQMMEPVEFPENKGPSTAENKPYATTGTKESRKPNIVNSLYLKPDQLEKTIVERFKRYEVIKQNEVMVEEYLTEDADIITVAYGATARVVKTAVDKAREEGIKVGLIRPITIWPFPEKSIAEAAKKVNNMLVVEMSMGQMVEDVRLYANGQCDVSFFGRTGGIVPSPAEVLTEIKKLAGGAK